MLRETPMKIAGIWALFEQLYVLGVGILVSVLITQFLSSTEVGIVKTIEALCIPTVYMVSLGFERTLVRFGPELIGGNAEIQLFQLMDKMLLGRISLAMFLAGGVYFFATELGDLVNAPIIFSKYLIWVELTLISLLFSHLCRGWLAAVGRRELASQAAVIRRTFILISTLSCFWFCLLYTSPSPRDS